MIFSKVLNILKNYIKFLSIISPIIPHFSSECLDDLKLKSFQKWPEVDKNLIKKDTIEYVIQINGKKRATLKYMKNILIIGQKSKLAFENLKKIQNIFHHNIPKLKW